MDDSGKHTVLRADQLSAGYRKGRKARVIVRDVNLSLTSGQVFALIGPNGSGKSTLLRTLSGLQPPLSGEIWIDGSLMKQLSARMRARKVSVMLTQRPPTGTMTVREVLRTGLYPFIPLLRFQPDPRAEQRITEVASSLRFADMLDQQLHSLSDGQVQTAMLGRALVQDGLVIFLDEPGHHLDVLRKARIQRDIVRLARAGKSLFVSTHDIEWAWKHADCIGVLHEGRIHTGTPTSLGASGIMQEAYRDEHLLFDSASGRFVPS